MVKSAARRAGAVPGKEIVYMDIQKIINDVVAKLKADPSLLKSFAADPVKALEGITGLDLPDDQINAVIDGIKSKIDLGNVDLKEAAGIIDKIKGIFGK